MGFTKNQIKSERKDIDSVNNTIVIGDDIIRGVTKRRLWQSKYTLHTHIYCNAELAYQAKNRLYGFVAKLKQAFGLLPVE